MVTVDSNSCRYIRLFSPQSVVIATGSDVYTVQSGVNNNNIIYIQSMLLVRRSRAKQPGRQNEQFYGLFRDQRELYEPRTLG